MAWGGGYVAKVEGERRGKQELMKGKEQCDVAKYVSLAVLAWYYSQTGVAGNYWGGEGRQHLLGEWGGEK